MREKKKTQNEKKTIKTNIDTKYLHQGSRPLTCPFNLHEYFPHLIKKDWDILAETGRLQK